MAPIAIFPTQARKHVVAEPSPESVLTKAVARTAGLLEMNQAQLARVLGLSAPTASRLVAGQWQLVQGSKPWDFAALLIRVFRSLDGLTGGDADARRTWLESHNHALGGTPRSLLLETEGLIRVLHYLDAARAQH
jgi:hypothetical protein